MQNVHQAIVISHFRSRRDRLLPASDLDARAKVPNKVSRKHPSAADRKPHFPPLGALPGALCVHGIKILRKPAASGSNSSHDVEGLSFPSFPGTSSPLYHTIRRNRKHHRIKDTEKYAHMGGGVTTSFRSVHHQALFAARRTSTPRLSTNSSSMKRCSASPGDVVVIPYCYL